ncbi:hypothetical protein [Enterobacter roggenkampii]|uniref:hypothetical protein n=1 Tax=Enterobacter roggenkampii TaxID=1812935 RepID=UPI001D0C71C2|nr:hypothetical protein [Enterobacter roggenkampii]
MNVNAKPLSELRRLEQGLIAASTPFTCAPQQLITSGESNEPRTIVLQTGVIEIYRPSDELLVGIATAPFIFGLATVMINHSQEYRVNRHGFNRHLRVI